MLNHDIKQIYKECNEFDYFETANGVPIPFNDKWTKIGINISGGADSAILCYNICNHIIKHNLEVEIYTISHVRGWQIKPWQKHVRLEVIKKLKSMFPTIKFIEYENYIPTEIEYGIIGDVIPINNERFKIISLKKVAVIFFHKNIYDLYDKRWIDKSVQSILSQKYDDFDTFVKEDQAPVEVGFNFLSAVFHSRMNRWY